MHTTNKCMFHLSVCHNSKQVPSYTGEEMGKASNSLVSRAPALFMAPPPFCHSWPILLIKYFLIYQVCRERQYKAAGSVKCGHNKLLENQGRSEVLHEEHG